MSNYILPRSLEDTLTIIADGNWQLLAGGTDFYPQLGDKPVDFNIIDISSLDEIKGISKGKGYWRIGATTTWTELLETALPDAFSGLKLAAREVGCEQIQNAATVAGNLCNASPAADSVPPLLTLDAKVELQSVSGVRQLDLLEFIKGNRSTELHANEIMTAILVPGDRDDAKSHFLKLGTRKYLVISISMVSALIKPSTDGLVELARIAVGSCSAVARRLPELEAAITGQVISSKLKDFVTTKHMTPLAPIDDVRASAEYRMHAAEELVRRVLSECGAGAK